MMLSDIRDYIASLNLANTVYMGKKKKKEEKSIGVYHSKRSKEYRTAIGGPELESYGVKYITLLVHWNKSLRDTERAATSLFKKIQQEREAAVNGEKIKFFQPLYEIQDVGTDDAGIYEMVIEAAVVFGKKRSEQEYEIRNGPSKVCGKDGSVPVLRKPVPD